MRLRHLYYFHILAEELHFSRAAERLYIDPSSLSKAIKSLESYVGSVLINRNTKNPSLTKEGVIFLAETQPIFQSLEQAKKKINLAHNQLDCNLGISLHIDIKRLSDLLRVYRQEAANIHIHLHYVEQQALLDGLISGKYDLGLSSIPENRGNIVAQKLWEDQLVALLPKRHPLLELEKVSFRDLSSYTLICFHHNCTINKKILNAFKSHNLKPKHIECVKTYDLVLTLIAAGFGVALMTENVFKSMKNEHVIIRQISEDYKIGTFLLSPQTSFQCEKFQQIIAKVYSPKSSFFDD